MGSSKVVTFSYLDLPPMPRFKEPSMGDELSCSATNVRGVHSQRKGKGGAGKKDKLHARHVELS